MGIQINLNKLRESCKAKITADADKLIKTNIGNAEQKEAMLGTAILLLDDRVRAGNTKFSAELDSMREAMLWQHEVRKHEKLKHAEVDASQDPESVTTDFPVAGANMGHGGQLAGGGLPAVTPAIQDIGLGGSQTQWNLGSVQDSILTEAQFLSALPEADRDKWALADGRDITGTALATITGVNTLPDLRGAYLRMAGVNAAQSGWNGGTLGAFEEDTTRRPRNAFVITEAGEHVHPVKTFSWDSGLGHEYNPESTSIPDNNVGDTSWPQNQNMRTDKIRPAGKHTHGMGGGDYETRPKTFAINYFIKVD